MVKNHDRRSNHVDTVHECDRRTDRQTDGRITITKTVQRIASHGKMHVRIRCAADALIPKSPALAGWRYRVSTISEYNWASKLVENLQKCVAADRVSANRRQQSCVAM